MAIPIENAYMLPSQHNNAQTFEIGIALYSTMGCKLKMAFI